MPDTQSERNLALVVYVLFATGIILPLTTLIGVIIAYVKRGDLSSELYADHLSFLIRTFWVSFIGALISYVLLSVFIGYLLLAVVGIWYIVRVIYGLVKFLDNQPVNPESWLL